MGYQEEPIEVLASALEREGLFHDKKGRPVEVPAPLAPLADTHGHLTCLDGLDPALALCRAALAGVRLLVVPVDPVDEIPRKFASPQAMFAWIDRAVARAAELLSACAERGMLPPEFDGSCGPLVENVYLVAGAHPYGAADLGSKALSDLEALLASPRCVGVGEIGIDFGPYNTVPAEVQERAFRTQLRIAHEHDLPVELHLRDAAGDEGLAAHALAARVLEEEGVPSRGCDLHCYTLGPEAMEPFIRLGCHFAFGGALTFKRSDNIRRAGARCPEHLMLSETDSPYMAPVPLRGRNCEPAMVAFTMDCLADVREQAGFARQDTYRACWENAGGFFSLS